MRCDALSGRQRGFESRCDQLSILKNAFQHAGSASRQPLAAEVGVLSLRCAAVA